MSAAIMGAAMPLGRPARWRCYGTVCALAREMERQPLVYEVDGAPHGTGWRADAPAVDAESVKIEGLDASFDPDAVPDRQHCNLLRHLHPFLDAVMAGRISMLETHQAYGAQPRGARGRPRRFTDFAVLVDDQIRYAEDPAVQRELCRLPARNGQRRAQAASADSLRINELFETTGSERAERSCELGAGANRGAPT